MAEMGEPRTRDALREAAERLEMVVRGVRSRHVAEVQGGSAPPPSMVYVRSEEAFDRPFMNDPAQAWVQTPPAAKWAAPQSGRSWRRYMPWPVRWVMGWP